MKHVTRSRLADMADGRGLINIEALAGAADVTPEVIRRTLGPLDRPEAKMWLTVDRAVLVLYDLFGGATHAEADLSTR